MERTQEHSQGFNAALDRVLAYVMGEGTAEERLEFEMALEAGDPDITIAYYEVSGTLARLPSVLDPVTPPPFAKDRVLAKVRLDAVPLVLPERVMPTAIELVAQDEPAAIPPRRATILPYIPAIDFSRIITSKRFAKAAMIGGFTVSGMFASAYAVNEVSDFIVKARKQQEARVEEIKKAAAAPESVMPQVYATVQKDRVVLDHVSISGPDAVISEQEISASSVKNVELATPKLGKQTPIHFPKSIAVREVSSVAKTNFNEFELSARLISDQTSLRHKLQVSPNGLPGKATVTWSPSTGESMFRVSDLAPTDPNSVYVLYFVHRNGKAEVVKTLTAASGANTTFALPKLPSGSVEKMVLTLERQQPGKPAERVEVLRSNKVEKVNR